MINKALFTSNTAEWATPQAFFEELNREFNFTLDPCATAENAKCARFFTKEQNGLLQSWRGERVFCNPPYGREIRKWVEKASREISGGGARLLLCSFLRERTHRISTITYTASMKFGLFGGDCILTKAILEHRFLQCS